MHPYAILANLNTRLVVCGGGGFIGGHLVRHLLRMGYRNVRAVDLKPLEAWSQVFEDAENLQLDLRDRHACKKALAGMDVAYNLAAQGENPESAQSLCMLNSLINSHLLMAASESRTCRNYFFASSSSVYPIAHADLQPEDSHHAKVERFNDARAESWAYPAMPMDQSGWEKLFSERMCNQFMLDYGVATYVARLHQVFGPYGSLEHAPYGSPLDICRRIAEAQLEGAREVEIHGSAEDRHSWTYVDDCVLGMSLIVRSGMTDPVNLGSRDTLTTSELFDLVNEIAEAELKPKYLPQLVSQTVAGPSDNTLIREQVSWQPSTTFREGLESTWQWVQEQAAATHAGAQNTSAEAQDKGEEEQDAPAFRKAC